MDAMPGNSTTASPRAGSGSFPFELTDLCVKCGLCAPHCPTYRLTGEEGESPRGRISLIQGLAAGQLEATPRMQEHLDNCLTCRSCERVCPAKVPFGQIIDAGREELRGRRGPGSISVRVMSSMSSRPLLARFALNFAHLSSAIGMGRLIRKLGLADRSWLFRALTRLNITNRTRFGGKTYQAQNAEIGEISFFTGCVARTLDADTHQASLNVLNSIGYTVHVPPGQTCCGALSLHDGDRRSAVNMARANEAAFGNDDSLVISSATGCGATLREYDRLLDGESNCSINRRVVDISDFLSRRLPQIEPLLGALDMRIALHKPCTTDHVTTGGDATSALLDAIPGLHVEQLHGYGCCGAAGHHFLTRATQADALVSPLLDEVEEYRPRYVVTSNPGCALHLAGGLAARGSEISVIHPVGLVALSMARSAGHTVGIITGNGSANDNTR
jgi:glycolate oxidase iron-sulfur subunit